VRQKIIKALRTSVIDSRTGEIEAGEKKKKRLEILATPAFSFESRKTLRNKK